MLTKNNRKYTNVVAEGKTLPSLKEFIAIVATFSLTIFAWIFFRAENIEQALDYISKMPSLTLFSVPIFEYRIKAFLLLFIIVIFLLIEWRGRADQYAIEKSINRYPSALRYLFYYTILFLIFFLGGQEQQFIYFQF